MIRINDREVQLTDHELACLDAHGGYLDQGYSTYEATLLTRGSHDIYNRLSPEFIAYLNE